MSKKFVVGVSGLSDDEKSQFKAFVKENGWGWWHWIDELWLLSTTGNKDSTEIRDKIIEIAQDSNAIVLEIEPVTWRSYGPESDDVSFSTWLKRNWKRK